MERARVRVALKIRMTRGWGLRATKTRRGIPNPAVTIRALIARASLGGAGLFFGFACSRWGSFLLFPHSDPSPYGDLGAVFKPKFFQDSASEVFHTLFAHAKALGDLAVGIAIGDQVYDLAFPRGESHCGGTSSFGWWWGFRHSPELAFSDGFYGFHKGYGGVLPIDHSKEFTRGVGIGFGSSLFFGKDEEFEVGKFFCKLRESLFSELFYGSVIRYEDVGAIFADEFQSLLGFRSSSCDLESFGLFQEG